MTYIFENTIVEFLRELPSPGNFSFYDFIIKPTDLSLRNQVCEMLRITEEPCWETVSVASIPGTEKEEDLARRAFEHWKKIKE